jgi:O-antigen/teichoic acid export membrane protein
MKTGAPPSRMPSLAAGARVTREFALVLLGQAGVAVAGLVGLRLLTTLLVPAEFGRLALGVSLAALLQQITFGPLAVATLRFAGPAQDAADFPGFVAEVDRLLFRATGLCLVIAVGAGAAVLLLGVEHWVAFGGACLWFAVASGVLSTRLSLDAALRRRGWVAGVQVGSETIRFGFGAGAVVLFGTRSALFVMIGFAAAATLSALIQRRRAAADRRREPGEWTGRVIHFARPLALTGALTWSQMASDRWSLNALLSTAHVGAYSVIYQIAVAPFSLVGTMIQQLLAPIVFRSSGSGGEAASVRASHRPVLLAVAVLLLATAAAAGVAWRFHDMIFSIMVGPGYDQYSSLLPLGVVAGGLLASAQVVATTILTRGATRELIVPKAVTAVMGVGLNILGAYLFGIQGVLFANAVFGLVYFGWMYVTAGRTGGGPPRTSPYLAQGGTAGSAPPLG